MDSNLRDDVQRRVTYADLARSLGVTRQAVFDWFQDGSRIPAERVVEVAKLTGIPRHRLRPDVFPDEETNEVAS